VSRNVRSPVARISPTRLSEAERSPETAPKGRVRVCRAHYKEWKKERTDDHDRDYW